MGHFRIFKPDKNKVIMDTIHDLDKHYAKNFKKIDNFMDKTDSKFELMKDIGSRRYQNMLQGDHDLGKRIENLSFACVIISSVLCVCVISLIITICMFSSDIETLKNDLAQSAVTVEEEQNHDTD